MPEEDSAAASLSAEARFESTGMARLFRDPGEKNRERHKEFGLDLWYSVEVRDHAHARRLGRLATALA